MVKRLLHAAILAGLMFMARAVSAQSPSVLLNWSATTCGSITACTITGYNVYRGPATGMETFLVGLGVVTTYTDSAVTAGNHYCYYVTASWNNGTTTRQTGPTNKVCVIVGQFATLSPTSLTFGPTAVGNSSASQTATLTNTGTDTLGSIAISISGQFAQTSDCAATLAAAAHCTITVTYNPTVAGAASGSLSVADNASGSPQHVSLTGSTSGTPSALGLSPSSLAFGTVNLSSSSSLGITVTDNGAAAVTFSSIALSGSSDFALTTNSCGSGLAAHASCSLSVSYTPSSAGATTGTLTISGIGFTSPVTASLTGVGGSSTLLTAPSSLSFIPQQISASSHPHAVTLVNTGNVAISFTSISLGGTDAAQFSKTPAQTCGATLAAQSSCTVYVTFSPTTTGAKSATLTITSSAQGGPTVVNLSGTGRSRTVVLPQTEDSNP